MDRWVALLKGVNVGGNNPIKSADLQNLARDLGWHDVKTYLASGNVVFGADGAARSLAASMSEALKAEGLAVPVAVIGGADLARRRASCPFQPTDNKRVHGFFCMAPPVVDEGLIASLSTQGEEVFVQGRTIWLHTPSGFGVSKLAEKFPKVVSGTDMTARNLNTITKLVEMLDNG